MCTCITADLVWEVHSGRAGLKRHSQTLCIATTTCFLCAATPRRLPLFHTACCPIWDNSMWWGLTGVKDCPHQRRPREGKEEGKKKKTGHILTPDNRCCHSEPIIVSIMKSVGAEKRRSFISLFRAELFVHPIIHQVPAADNCPICIWIKNAL